MSLFATVHDLYCLSLGGGRQNLATVTAHKYVAFTVYLSIYPVAWSFSCPFVVRRRRRCRFRLPFRGTPSQESRWPVVVIVLGAVHLPFINYSSGLHVRIGYSCDRFHSVEITMCSPFCTTFDQISCNFSSCPFTEEESSPFGERDEWQARAGDSCSDDDDE